MIATMTFASFLFFVVAEVAVIILCNLKGTATTISLFSSASRQSCWYDSIVPILLTTSGVGAVEAVSSHRHCQYITRDLLPLQPPCKYMVENIGIGLRVYVNSDRIGAW